MIHKNISFIIWGMAQAKQHRPSQMESADEMTPEEVCQVLGISRPTLNRRIADGELTPVPKAPGQKRRYRVRFNRAYIERKVREGQAQQG